MYICTCTGGRVTGIKTCGECPRFQVKEKPGPLDWEGRCEALDVGRNAGTQACANPRLMKWGTVEL